MSARVLLVGYYGKGNFGDDVLLFVTHRIVKQALPDARIHVIVDGAAGGYVPQLLGEVTVLPPGRHGRFDLIIHGGGGVYFDFAAHGARDVRIERLIERLGYRGYVALEKLVRCVTGRPRTSARTRLGMGIGVGTYTPGSPRLRASLPILADYAALWVRDEESIANLQRVASVMRGEVIRGSDLAFLTQYWLRTPAMRPPADRPRLGIVLRDWPSSMGGLPADALQAALSELAREYQLTGFILDRHADPQLQQLLAGYDTCIWQPESMRIDDFMRTVAQQDVLLASRAHGAICGACVGVPSVILAIEPKLQQVAAMLPNASRVVAPDAPQEWAAALSEARAIPAQAIAGDVANNRAASAAALAQMQRWLA